ncbi:MAG: outer membrane beta-barrel protein [Bacteroidales bacterium]|nr:outer membrane beta-barrel protein [Bacteroidales bacterium]
MKKTAFSFIVLFAAAFAFTMQAQGTGAAKGAAGGAADISPFALQVHLGEGWGDYPGLDGDATTAHRITSGGVSGHYALNSRWSLWLGLDYQYRLTKGYSISDTPEGLKDIPFTKKKHYFCLPLQLEYEGPRWFYLHLGPNVERAYDRWIAANAFEVCVVGGMLGTGAHFRLTPQSELRVGLTLSVGSQLKRYEQYEYDYATKTYKEKGLSGIKVDKFCYFNGMFQVGYLYRFAR